MGEHRWIEEAVLFTTRMENCKTNWVAALRSNLAPSSEPSLVRPAIGGPRIAPRRSLRQAPRFGRAHGCASPEIRVSPSGFRRLGFRTRHVWKNKNPPERRLGRVCGKTQMSDGLSRSAPMSRACTIEWRMAIQGFHGLFAIAKHHTSHVRFTNTMSVRARFLCARILQVKHTRRFFFRLVRHACQRHAPCRAALGHVTLAQGETT